MRYEWIGSLTKSAHGPRPVLALTNELVHGTINKVMAKSDLELSIEALVRG